MRVDWCSLSLWQFLAQKVRTKFSGSLDVKSSFWSYHSPSGLASSRVSLGQTSLRCVPQTTSLLVLFPSYYYLFFCYSPLGQMKAKAWMLFVTFIDSILGFHHLCLWRPHCWPRPHLVRRRQRAFIHCCGIPPQVTSTNTFFHIWKPLTRYMINFFRIVGRLPIFLLAAAINLGVIVAMMVVVAS